MINIFNKSQLKKLYKPSSESSSEANGQVMIIGGSKLFHGAPLLSLKVASRIAGMVFFASPEPSVGRVAERIKSKLFSFIWVPREEVDEYIAKSDAVLIGPGLMRYGKEQKNIETKEHKNSYDKEGERTRKTTKRLLQKFPKKRWVIDAGSLQVMDADWIPRKAILTPNLKEFELLFKLKVQDSRFKITSQNLKFLIQKAKKHECVIVAKGSETIACSLEKCVKIPGGNAGLNKGGIGDVLAGLTVALLAKNDPFLAACSASYISKAAADALHSRVGPNYNADDLAEKIPETLAELLQT